VIRVLRNLAVKNGQIHPFYKTQGNSIVTNGRIFEDEEDLNDMRDDMDLPPISPVDQKEHLKIMELCGLKKLLSKKNNRSEEKE
jgi:heterodisulfide reductase subunit C